MSAAAPRFHRLAVNDLRREASDAVSMTFVIPRELADDYAFSPGQYLRSAPRSTVRRCDAPIPSAQVPTTAKFASP